MSQPTISKLKSLIEAIDLMSEEEEWTPTARQWKRIREMIEGLEEGPTSQPTYTPAPTHYGTGHVERPTGTSNPWASGQGYIPEVPSAIPADAPRAPTGSALTPPPRQSTDQPTMPEGGQSGDEGKPPPSPGL